MAFETREAELGLLLTEMLNEPEDRHELYLQIRQRLAEMKAFGMPLPADLVQFEHDLEAEFTSDVADAARAERMRSVAAARAARRQNAAGKPK